MKKGFLFSLCLIITFLIGNGRAGMSEKQLQAAVKLVRNLCQPKSKATDEDIEKMHQGDWNIDHNAMCYMYCGMTRNNLMTKENTLDMDHAISLAKKNLPEGRKAATLESIDKCKDAAKTLDDSCAAAYELAKCFYESNPANYFFP